MEKYLDKLDECTLRIPDIINSREFSAEMGRFIPFEVQERTLLKDKFKEYLAAEISEILLHVKSALTP